jgi:beta-N-acetylhexosaminidase
MRTTRLIFGVLLICALVSPASAMTPVDWEGQTSPADKICDTQVESLLAEMTLPEKVGQMVMVLNAPGFGDFTDTATLLREYDIGSVVSHAYFGLSATDAATYNNSLQEAAAGTRLGIPILNAADFESGVTILVADGTSLPTEMGLGAAHQSANKGARAAAEITAQEARALGFNWTFSPLVDVLTTPLNGEQGVRTFGGIPSVTSRLAASQIRSFQDNGLIATAKHFPGMGGSEVNSHFDLPRVSYDTATLERTHLPPFRAAIRAGVEAIMTGHIVVEAVDPDLPATLSRAVTTDLLREELGFDGVIITDSMTQAAVLTHWGIVDAALMAVEAGADILMEIGPTEVPILVIQAVLGAVDDGTITEGRIDTSVRRVLSLKCRYGLLGDTIVDPADVSSFVGTPVNAATAADLSRRGITLVRNEGILPFAKEDGSRTLVAGVTHPTSEVIPMPPASHVPTLASLVEEATDGSVVWWAAETEDPTEEEIAAAIALAADADRIIVATYSAGRLPAGQAELVDALLDTGKPLVAISTGTPYDLALYPEVRAYVAAHALTFLPTYAFSSSLLNEAVNVVFGAQPGGRLTVPIADLYPVDHGLRYQGN